MALAQKRQAEKKIKEFRSEEDTKNPVADAHMRCRACERDTMPHGEKTKQKNYGYCKKHSRPIYLTLCGKKIYNQSGQKNRRGYNTTVPDRNSLPSMCE